MRNALVPALVVLVASVKASAGAQRAASVVVVVETALVGKA